MANTANLFNSPIILLLMFLFSSTLSGSAVVHSLQFRVGGSRGWAPPPDSASHSLYNQWATENRFHVGDSLLFVYSSNNESDSVLVVNSTAYSNCIPSHPILLLNGARNATFRFDQPGLFYFISGQARNCIAGQKLVVRVMADEIEDDDQGPSPAPGNEDLIWDGLNWPPAINSTVKTTIASYFITALGGVLVILYLLM